MNSSGHLARPGYKSPHDRDPGRFIANRRKITRWSHRGSNDTQNTLHIDRNNRKRGFDAKPVGTIRKASLFARERKRDSEEEVLLKMADLGGGRHPVSAVRSKQLTRRAFWADPTIHYLGHSKAVSRPASCYPSPPYCCEDLN